jgi:hypothetical protein
MRRQTDLLIYKLRNSNPKVWTWIALDRDVLGVMNAHGGRSFEAYERVNEYLSCYGRGR